MKVFVGPSQLLLPLVKVGVTTIVATIGAVVVLTATNDAILPVPDPAKPIVVLLFVQAYVVVPIVFVVAKVIAAVATELQTTWFTGCVTCPVGLTVIVNVFVVPEQLLPPFVKIGVTTIVATIGAVVVLTAVNEGISPVPDPAKPIDVALLVQV